MISSNTLILGIGNTLLADEGTGIHMLDYMSRHYPDLTGVEYLDGGTLSFTLAPWIEEADNLIVIDAAELDAPPGTVEVFTGEEMDRFAGKTKRSVHEVSLGDLLAIAHLTGTIPENRVLVAIQPEKIDWGSCLSNPVKRALPAAAQQIVERLGRWHPQDSYAGVGLQPALLAATELGG
ncbi:MAG: HyaD/HybD family hydrogenase maturation endopeptidase [Gammaproteobacteria bacterium]|nr:HyaD/HybD family hydrogenase maturation endopeptidase [Gammaproteobacteria bacterium]